MIQDTRIQELNERPERDGQYVLYFMQQAVRTRFNHALELTIRRANELGVPPLVCFGLMDDYPEANERHYAFLLEGLRDVEANLKARGIKFVVRHGSPEKAALHYAKEAALVICDRGYLRHQKAWRDALADHAPCEVMEVESDVVVPVDVASDKHESAARTIRPKIHKKWDEYLQPLRPTKVKHPSLHLKVTGNIEVAHPAATLKKLKLDRSVAPTPFFTGGEDQAARLLASFTQSKLDGYAEGRNEPSADRHSYMSMYLHFGHVSPLELALHVRDQKNAPAADRDSYLEELIIRRELSMNFCNFEPRYDSYACLPNWAHKTLADHASDERPITYTLKQLEESKTQDPYWNAAQTQMVVTGFMHNYMRMYWGKKILEWTKSPKEAFERTLYLNNKYEMDGRDANSFANVAWIFGLHDRPWGRRAIFGNVRYMNAAGLERKFDIQKYVEQIHDVAKEHSRKETPK
ncbi:MAG: phrB [Phycisphaerales bacterium]|nr:phrB [Phycisphaerales bacterium]